MRARYMPPVWQLTTCGHGFGQSHPADGSCVQPFSPDPRRIRGSAYEGEIAMALRPGVLRSGPAVVAAAVAVVPAANGQADAPPAGLRLLVGSHPVVVQRFEEDPFLFVPAAVYVAPT